MDFNNFSNNKYDFYRGIILHTVVDDNDSYRVYHRIFNVITVKHQIFTVFHEYIKILVQPLFFMHV